MTTQLPQPCLPSLFSIGPHCLLGSRLCCLCCKLPSSPPLHSAWAQRSRTPVCVPKGSGGILGPWLTTPLSFRLCRPLRPAFPLPCLQASHVVSPQQGCISSQAPALRAAPSVSPVLSGLALATVSLAPAGCLIHGKRQAHGLDQSSELGTLNPRLCHVFSSVQLLRHVRLCNPMDCSTPGFPVHHQLLELTQTHVH